MPEWKPGASLAILQKRAELLARTRAFFAERRVLEVETPLLASSTVTDLAIESFQVGQRYLQTSPEYAMKRLLAAGSGPVFQICKAFRQEQAGRLHNPEFTLLEWYRPGFDWRQLMDEIAELLETLLEVSDIPRFSYASLFQQALDVDPHSLPSEELARLARMKIDLGKAHFSDTDYLQMLMHHCIEPSLPEFCFVYDYPAEQAALAVTEQDEEGRMVARRFELYGRGMELANAYQELTDAEEQRRRFKAENARRRQQGLVEKPLDEKLLAALASGMQDCAGVALGFDRLLMLACDCNSLDEVISFADDRA